MSGLRQQQADVWEPAEISQQLTSCWRLSSMAVLGQNMLKKNSSTVVTNDSMNAGEPVLQLVVLEKDVGVSVTGISPTKMLSFSGLRPPK